MQKVINARVVVVIAVTLLSILVTLPTMRYFGVVGAMDDNPTPEQIAKRDKLLENKQLVKFGLDLQGGTHFLLAVDSDKLRQRQLENAAEGLRKKFSEGNSVDASVILDTKDPANYAVTVKLNNAKDLNYAADAITESAGKGRTIALEVPPTLKADLGRGETRLKLIEESLKDEIRSATESSKRVLEERLDQFGMTQPIIARVGDDRILIQIPGESDPARVRQGLLRTASLEFRLLHPQHDSLIADFSAGGMVEGVGTGRVKPELVEEVPSPVAKDKKVKRLKENIPGIPAGYTLRLGRKPYIDTTTGQAVPEKSIDDLVYLVKASTEVTGDELRRAAAITDTQDLEDPIKVSFEFDRLGAKKFATVTTEHTGERFAVILDDVVYSAPNIREPITGGSGVIEGNFTQAEAHDLALTLKAGALKAPLKIVEENIIGATLGVGSIKDSGKSLLLGGALIVALMAVYYHACGAIAVIAMTINVLIILATMALMGATLTLSGIGGILLTMGMAVDANVLIYERLREELRAGKPLRAAINIAFDRAFTVIFDSNLTSLLPALVLVLFEVVQGSVKGFWLALGIGIIANMFTGIFVTRVLMELWYAKFKTIDTGKIDFFGKIQVQWTKYRNAGLAFSVALTIVSVAYLGVRGFNFGIDFTGGVVTTVEVPGTAGDDQAKIIKAFEAEFPEVRVVKVLGKDQWQITVPQKAKAENAPKPTLESIREQSAATLKAVFAGKEKVLSSQSVDPVIGGEFKWTAFFTIAITCAIIIGYLGLRFQVIFGVGAVLALLHDVFLSIGIFRLFGHSITMDIVSAVLIILGYSVNDTIVVFDRIRELLADRHTGKIEDIFNRALNETLSRTILTGTSTLIAITSMFLFGGVGLSDFALILLIGLAFGTYSSIFVASMLVYWQLMRKGGDISLISGKKPAVAKVQVPKAKMA